MRRLSAAVSVYGFVALAAFPPVANAQEPCPQYSKRIQISETEQTCQCYEGFTPDDVSKKCLCLAGRTIRNGRCLPIDRALEAQAKLARVERASALRVHRQHVKGLQEALRRLDRTMLTVNAERDQWKKATDQAMKNAWKRGRSMLIDETIGALGKRLTRQLRDANEEIRRAVDMLAGETNPARRERLHSAIKLMGKHRKEIRRAKKVMLKRVAEAHKIYDAADWATGQSDDLEKSLRAVYNMVKMTLDDPALQKALKMSGVPGAVAKYGESIADSALDITTEIISWKRINQLNLTTDAYLAAVGDLSEKMERVVRKIEAIKSQ